MELCRVVFVYPCDWEAATGNSAGENSIVHRKLGQELKHSRILQAGADADAKAMEECCLLACSSWLA